MVPQGEQPGGTTRTRSTSNALKAADVGKLRRGDRPAREGEEPQETVERNVKKAKRRGDAARRRSGGDSSRGNPVRRGEANRRDREFPEGNVERSRRLRPNTANPRVGSGAKQTRRLRAGQTVEGVQNPEDGHETPIVADRCRRSADFRRSGVGARRGRRRRGDDGDDPRERIV